MTRSSRLISFLSFWQKIPTDSRSQNHTKGFTKSAGTEEAFAATMKAVKGLAAVGCRILADSSFLNQVKRSFEADTKSTIEINDVQGI
jgi:hypothetical protein